MFFLFPFQSQRLVKGRNTYTDWKGPSTIPRYTKFYIFNVTNPDEVKDGGKPNVSEVGPYTYALVIELINFFLFNCILLLSKNAEAHCFNLCSSCLMMTFHFACPHFYV